MTVLEKVEEALEDENLLLACELQDALTDEEELILEFHRRILDDPFGKQ